MTDNASADATSMDRLTAHFIEAGISEMAARILQASLELFAHKGYAATSVREIVQEAGATNPMLYYYFGSKEGVFVRLLELMFSIIHERIEAEVPADRTLYEKIRGVISTHVDTLREAPLAVQFVYSVIFGPQRIGPSFNVINSNRQSFRQLERVFQKSISSGEIEVRQGFDARFLAEQLLGMINSHMMHTLNMLRCAADTKEHLEFTEYYLGEEAVDRLVNFFLAGAGKLKSEEPS